MFQTAINHFLQSFATPALTSFMRLITALGYIEFFIGFLIILLLAIDFKKAFILFMVLMWTAAITFFFKDYFDLPRPFHVDNTLQYLDGKLGDESTFDFNNRGATTFWGSLPPDVLEVTRKTENVENGFPSGHTSIAIAFWGALILLYRNKWVNIISISLMLLIPLSRMYLGVHFLADILGGAALGAIMLGLFYLIILKQDKLNNFYKNHNYPIGINALTAILLLPPLLFIFILPEKIYTLPAFMLGFGLGFLLLASKGLPINQGTIVQRIQRTMLGILTLVIVSFLMKFMAASLGLEHNVWMSFLRDALTGLALIWMGTEISIRLGWFKRGMTVV